MAINWVTAGFFFFEMLGILVARRRPSLIGQINSSKICSAVARAKELRDIQLHRIILAFQGGTDTCHALLFRNSRRKTHVLETTSTKSMSLTCSANLGRLVLPLSACCGQAESGGLAKLVSNSQTSHQHGCTRPPYLLLSSKSSAP